jgi:hypothetical protein
METTQILAEIDAEIRKLQDVRALLAGNNSHPRPGRPPKKKRTLSPEARAKIAAAQRARWAKQKKAAK